MSVLSSVFRFVNRKKKAVHKTTTTDDKRLQNTLKRLGVNTIPGIEEVNIFKDETVIHFVNPKGMPAWLLSFIILHVIWAFSFYSILGFYFTSFCFYGIFWELSVIYDIQKLCFFSKPFSSLGSTSLWTSFIEFSCGFGILDALFILSCLLFFFLKFSWTAGMIRFV